MARESVPVTPATRNAIDYHAGKIVNLLIASGGNRLRFDGDHSNGTTWVSCFSQAVPDTGPDHDVINKDCVTVVDYEKLIAYWCRPDGPFQNIFSADAVQQGPYAHLQSLLTALEKTRGMPTGTGETVSEKIPFATVLDRVEGYCQKGGVFANWHLWDDEWSDAENLSALIAAMQQALTSRGSKDQVAALLAKLHTAGQRLQTGCEVTSNSVHDAGDGTEVIVNVLWRHKNGDPKAECRPKLSNATVFRDIEAELTRARTKFPGGENNFAALVEEVGEVAQAILKIQHEGGKSHEDVYQEAIQTAVTAIRLATEGDASFPAYDPESGYHGKDWRGYKRNAKLDPLSTPPATTAPCGPDTTSGDRVIFMDKNGYPHQREGAAKAGLKAGQEYTVSEVEVSQSRTDLALEGVPGTFNSVMFTPAPR